MLSLLTLVVFNSKMSQNVQIRLTYETTILGRAAIELNGLLGAVNPFVEKMDVLASGATIGEDITKSYNTTTTNNSNEADLMTASVCANSQFDDISAAISGLMQLHSASTNADTLSDDLDAPSVTKATTNSTDNSSLNTSTVATYSNADNLHGLEIDYDRNLHAPVVHLTSDTSVARFVAYHTQNRFITDHIFTVPHFYTALDVMP